MQLQIALGILLVDTATVLSSTQSIVRDPKRLHRRQTGPVSPGIAPDCTYWDTAREGLNICPDFQSSCVLTFVKFLEYVRLVYDPNVWI